LTAKESLAKSEQKKVMDYLDSINTQNPKGSANLRKNLILNGIDFIKSAPIIGIGPGGFARKIKHNEHKYYVHTHTSPHNFPIELISQFGIFGWLYLTFLILVVAKLLQLWRKMNSNQKVALVILLASMPLLWMMPSAFLYLNIHCLFLPLLLILLDTMKDKPHLDGIK
jgi:O-antigen ligase